MVDISRSVGDSDDQRGTHDPGLPLGQGQAPALRRRAVALTRVYTRGLRWPRLLSWPPADHGLSHGPAGSSSAVLSSGHRCYTSYTRLPCCVLPNEPSVP